MPATIAELCLRVDADRSTPRYLSDRDLPWLDALLSEYRAFEGERRSLLRERLREPLTARAPYAKLRVVDHLLEELAHDRVSAVMPPAEARWLLFRTATQFPGPREEVLTRAAEVASVTPQALDASLFADLASERRVGPLPASLCASECIPLANRAMVAALLSRAVEVRVSVSGEPAIATFACRAQGLGLICSRAPSLTNLPPSEGTASTLYVSGPLALFRHTQVYARSLAALVPALLGAGPFELRAACRFERVSEAPPLCVSAGDPLGAGAALDAEPLLSRLVADFRAVSDEWQMEESSATWRDGAALVCAQFELFEKARPERRFPLHIIRFWTEDSLSRVLAWAELHRGLIWVDAAGACDEGDACGPSSIANDGPLARALFFRKRPDVRKLLTWLREQP